MTKIENLRQIMFDLWAAAKKLEYRRVSGLKRLKSFPLICRLHKYRRFNKIRDIIKIREHGRSTCVMMALGTSREIRRIERKLRMNEQSSK